MVFSIAGGGQNVQFQWHVLGPTHRHMVFWFERACLDWFFGLQIEVTQRLDVVVRIF